MGACATKPKEPKPEAGGDVPEPALEPSMTVVKEEKEAVVVVVAEAEDQKAEAGAEAVTTRSLGVLLKENEETSTEKTEKTESKVPEVVIVEESSVKTERVAEEGERDQITIDKEMKEESITKSETVLIDQPISTNPGHEQKVEVVEKATEDPIPISVKEEKKEEAVIEKLIEAVINHEEPKKEEAVN